MKSTRIKIFQRSGYHQVEQEFNNWFKEREASVADEASNDTDETLSMPPHTHLSFDSSLQKYILTVVYNIQV